MLECSNFPIEFRTQDLMAFFAPYAKESGFDLKWVDDTHCLVVFSSAKVGTLINFIELSYQVNRYFPSAAEVLSASHPMVRLKSLSEATSESRTKAR